jgi:hypothetical protein
MMLRYKKTTPRMVIKPLTPNKIKLIHDYFVTVKKIERHPWI